MAKQHDKAVDRILASEMALWLEDAEAGGADNPFAATCGAAGLCRDDAREVIAAARRKFARLEKSAKPLGASATRWVAELRAAYPTEAPHK